jgi:hypothetical protein
LKKVQTFITVLDTTGSDVHAALESNNKDFEDALQISTSHRHTKINAIITRNVKDFKKSQFPIWTAEQVVKMIKTW